MNLLTEYLLHHYDEVGPIDFYRDIFPTGELQEKGIYEKGKYNAIAVEVTNEKKKNGKDKVLRHTITDDLDKIREMVSRDNFCLMSPISYIGKERNSDNARFLYALVIDLDGVIIKNGDDPFGLRTLIHQIENINRIPMPTYIVSSGTGLHLYYVFEKPIMLFKNVVKQLQKYKKELTRIIWQDYITKLSDTVQYESLFQGFRIVGTITKKGARARAFKTGNHVTMEYMNQFVDKEFKAEDFAYKSKLTLAQAKEKYPTWYEERIIQKKPRGTWTVNRAVYEWWKKRILKEAKTGHRYYCLMMLAVYARKAAIDREELENDAFKMMAIFDKLPATDDNPFDEKDVIDALQAYEDKYITYPINSISYLTDIHIEKNKRNYRKRAQHIKIMNAIRDIEYSDSEWRNKEGRPKGSGTKEQIVKEYRENNPDARKSDCIRATGLDKKTVYKWW
ncbi:MAG: hypothetical protein KIB53_13885 [Paraclostridium bifermentans]|jgi:hypothetical protein|uniref:hypothetical protein n=3 Tax=Clostridia TaxID=186801 RepID=UPI001CB34326|nr:hypothetical protein [Paraclostridium bifermentans]EJT5915416.1 hypothetical protein [Clostridium perfringens]EJT6615253.1 hypothetical protein [Clostridium perfringens]MBS5954906.1 hypothetical protein [Paraclostridium bifermentans]HBI6929201.1 hypothetical protein [Clostridium perfringens]HBI6990533.1 hypothetical protein [Clostridium perfringens]